MENAGAALMGIGSAVGDDRAEEAARAAISSPLLEISINGAKGVLFSIAGGDDLTMFEIQDAAKIITESVDPNAKIIFGTVRDDKLKKGEIKITVIASNFSDNYTKKSSSLFQQAFGSEEDRTSKNPASAQTGKIFNTATHPQKEKDPVVAKEKKKVDTKQNSTPIEDNDDWSAVPSFLRRSKLK